MIEIENVLLEYRPNLSSINCFMYTQDAVTKPIKLVIAPEGIILATDKEFRSIITKGLFSIKNASLFNFNVENNFISFSFLNNKLSNEEILQPKINKLERSLFTELSLVINTNYMVTCSGCSAHLILGKSVIFHRILELPMQFEMEDMFCHLHSNEDDDTLEEQSLEMINDKYCHNDHGSGESVAHKFQPNMGDIFYGTFYILMNYSHFDKESIKQDGPNAHCKRCLHVIGQVSLNQNSLKIWCENIHFNKGFFYRTSRPIDLVTNAIKRIIFSYHIVPSIPSLRIILECVVPKTKSKHNLLLQVMDRNLIIYRKKKEDFVVNKTDAMKIMFCACHKQDTPGKLVRDELLKSWSKDLNVNTFEISFELLHSFYNHLEENSLLIPVLHRTNGLFTFSYLDL